MGNQCEDCETDWTYDSAEGAGASGSSHQMTFWIEGVEHMNAKFRRRFLSAYSTNRKSKIQNRNWIGLFTIVIALSMWGPVASAQLSKLTIGNNTLSAAGLPAWMAKESGIFQKNGLDVQIVYF